MLAELKIKEEKTLSETRKTQNESDKEYINGLQDVVSTLSRNDVPPQDLYYTRCFLCNWREIFFCIEKNQNSFSQL